LQGGSQALGKAGSEGVTDSAKVDEVCGEIQSIQALGFAAHVRGRDVPGTRGERDALDALLAQFARVRHDARTDQQQVRITLCAFFCQRDRSEAA
jgi:hypothetical protein